MNLQIKKIFFYGEKKSQALKSIVKNEYNQGVYVDMGVGVAEIFISHTPTQWRI